MVSVSSRSIYCDTLRLIVAGDSPPLLERFLIILVQSENKAENTFNFALITACGPIKWQIDDSIAPLGASFGETSVGIYTGSVNQQTLFLDIGTVSDPTQMMELPAVTIPGMYITILHVSLDNSVHLTDVLLCACPSSAICNGPLHACTCLVFLLAAFHLIYATAHLTKQHDTIADLGPNGDF